MLKKFGGLREYEGEPGFLYGDTLFVSSNGDLWTGCMESKVFTYYAVVHGTPRKFTGLKVLDRVSVKEDLTMDWLPPLINGPEPVQRPRKVQFVTSDEFSTGLICSSLEAVKSSSNWVMVKPAVHSRFAPSLLLHEIGAPAATHLVSAAMDRLHMGLPKPLVFAGMHEPLYELSRKFDLFLLAWLKRELKKQGIEHVKRVVA